MSKKKVTKKKVTKVAGPKQKPYDMRAFVEHLLEEDTEDALCSDVKSLLQEAHAIAQGGPRSPTVKPGQLWEYKNQRHLVVMNDSDCLITIDPITLKETHLDPDEISISMRRSGRLLKEKLTSPHSTGLSL